MNSLGNVICLEAPGIGKKGAVGIVLNSECASYAAAKTLLADRIANGEAFVGERIRVTSRATYRAAHGGADRVATGNEWVQAQDMTF